MTYRVRIIQFMIPHYRVAFYRKIAETPGVDAKVYYDPTWPHNSPSYPFPTEALSAYSIFGIFYWQYRTNLLDDLQRGDILVLMGNPRCISNILLIYQARRKGVCVIWWGIGSMPGTTQFRHRVRCKFMRRVDAVMFYNRQDIETFRNMGLITEKLYAADNSIDTETVDQHLQKWDPERLLAFREQEGLADHRILLFCGRLTLKSRLNEMLTAMPAILEAHPNTRLMVIGDGEERETFHDRCKELNLEDFVHFKGAIFDQEKLVPWFRVAEAFVYPGNIGLSGVHALTCSLPVVTHDNRTNHSTEAEALIEGENSLLFKERDPDDLARCLIELLSDRQKQAAMSQAARRVVDTKYNINNMVENFIQAFEAVRMDKGIVTE